MLFNMICKQYNDHREPGFDSLVSIKASFATLLCLLKTNPFILSIFNTKNIELFRNKSLLIS